MLGIEPMVPHASQAPLPTAPGPWAPHLEYGEAGGLGSEAGTLSGYCGFPRVPELEIDLKPDALSWCFSKTWCCGFILLNQKIV